MTHPNTLTAGIDTAKDKLDVAVHPSSIRLTVENRPCGHRRLAVELRRIGVARVGIEATGGYERGVLECLREQGFQVVLLQPLQVKAFARLHLRRAKNDALDAALIAACTALVNPPKTKHDPRIAPLADALTFVEQVEEDTARAKTRLEKTRDPRLRRMIEADIKRLAARRASELRRIALAGRRQADLARRLDLIESICGIGLRTALAIVLRMPEIGTISREQTAALAGLAPFDDDSGKHTGERHIAGGRERLRRSLYAAALAASFRWNPALIALYRRLTARGKTHNVALVACARKLIIYANTVVQRDTPWTTKKAGV
jgi:transposase